MIDPPQSKSRLTSAVGVGFIAGMSILAIGGVAALIWITFFGTGW